VCTYVEKLINTLCKYLFLNRNVKVKNQIKRVRKCKQSATFLVRSPNLEFLPLRTAPVKSVFWMPKVNHGNQGKYSNRDHRSYHRNEINHCHQFSLYICHSVTSMGIKSRKYLNLFSRSQVVTCGQMDGQTGQRWQTHFCNFRVLNAPKEREDHSIFEKKSFVYSLFWNRCPTRINNSVQPFSF
jgi:hypothetical protein